MESKFDRDLTKEGKRLLLQLDALKDNATLLNFLNIEGLEELAHELPTERWDSKALRVNGLIGILTRKGLYVEFLKYASQSLNPQDYLKQEIDKYVEKITRVFSEERGHTLSISAYATKLYEVQQTTLSKIQTQKDTGRIDQIIGSSINVLVNNLSAFFATSITTDVMLPALKEWRSGSIVNIDGINQEITNRTQRWLEEPKVKAKITQLVRQWSDTLKPEMISIVTDVFVASNFVALGKSDLSNEIGRIIDTNVVNQVKEYMNNVDEIVGPIEPGMEHLMASVVTAFILHHWIHGIAGPVGWALLVVEWAAIGAALAGAIIKTGSVKDAYNNANLPPWMRKIFLTDKKLRQLETDVSSKLETEMKASLNKIFREEGSLIDSLSAGYVEGLKVYLEQVMLDTKV